MLNASQRIDLMKLAFEIAKSEVSELKPANDQLATRMINYYAKVKAAIESGAVLDDTNVADVKAVVDVASDVEELLE